MYRLILLVALLALVAACPKGTEDFDGDGIPDEGDCDPGDPTVYPGAPDPVYNDVDNNCDGIPGVDSDGDGFASEGSGGEDCNDSDSGTNPGADEIPGNEADEDCNGESLLCDADSDGLESSHPACGGTDCDDFDAGCFSAEGCADNDADGQAVCKGDCDDEDARVLLENPEVCDGLDNDCVDGVPLDEVDSDADGYVACESWVGDAGSVIGGGDCDSEAPLSWPGAPEQCDLEDNDCDGTVDEGVDADGDGDGVTPCEGDCDDLSSAVFPQSPLWEGPTDPDWDCSGDRLKPLGWATTVVDAVSGDDEVGRAVAGGGDIDGDGLADVLVGAPGFEYLGTPWGGSFAFFGASLGGQSFVDLSGADATLLGGRDGTSRAGERLSALGDIDGDGKSEFLTAAPSGGSVVDLWPGDQIAPGGTWDGSMSLAWFTGEGLDEGAGSGLASAGDVDGDGVPEILVGAPQNSEAASDAGKAYLILGASILAGTQASSWNASLSDADIAIVGAAAGDRLGTSVAGVGDVDGDGLDDFLLGAPFADDGAAPNAGKAYLFLGSSLSAASSLTAASADRVYVGASGSRAGDTVAGLGDINGDGYSDFAIGTGIGGRAYVVLGSPTSPSAVDLPSAAAATVETGSAERVAVSGAGDVDGDGMKDLLLGRPGWQQTGGAALVLGSTLAAGSLLQWESSDALFVGEAAGDLAGFCTAGVGDVDGDGRDDLMFGAPNNGFLSPGAGRAYLFLSPF